MSRVTLTGEFERIGGGPASGTVRITPSRSPIMDPDGGVIISGPQTFPLDKDGKLVAEGGIPVTLPASDDPALGAPFTYRFDANLTHASWKVLAAWLPYGTAEVDLTKVLEVTPPVGTPTRTVTIPAEGADGQVLVWDGAGFSWDFPPEGPQGPPGEVTTAALTAALAGKVDGTGLTLRRDTTVGERVLLDHPGGTTMLYGDTGWRDMSGYLAPGVTGTFLARRRLHATDVKLNLTLTADSTLIGTGRQLNANLISGLPVRMFSSESYYISPLIMRDGTAGAPTGTVSIAYQSQTETRMRVTSSSAGSWSVGDTIRISGAIPNDQPWLDALPGTLV